MDTLPDSVLNHLLQVAAEPDLSGAHYEVIREIASGGMGTVYLARDTRLSRDVALKVVTTPDEARILAALEHPGIVPVHEAGRLPDGRLFYAMKFVQGPRLDQYSASDAPLTSRLRLFLRICDPVAFAHSRGVVHRDLKPENIISGEFGEVLILDWGIATPIDAAPAGVAGTPGYIAPEQARGQAADPRADIFSLGKILRTLIVNHEPPRPLRAIVEKAVHPDRGQRYNTVVDLAGDVASLLDGRPVTAYRENVLETAVRWLNRNKTVTALVITYIFVRALMFFLIHR